MAPIFICQDGMQPSGVATYGYAVLRRYPAARLLLLNATGVPSLAPREVAGQIRPVPEAASHDPVAVAQALGELVAEVSESPAILPNTGDTPWAATVEFLRMAPPALRDRVRVLGIVHSDMETQYALAERYRMLAPIWIGVSRRCAAELKRRIGSSGAAVHELPYPIAIPAAALRNEDRPLRLAYVGRLEEPQKRVSRLVALFTALVGRGVDFQATVVGDGPAAAEFGRALAAAGPTVNARVRTTGALGSEAVAAIWRSHDVAVLVSAFEGLPLALLEAMAAGVCPVAMAMDSGVDELIGDNAAGRIVPQGDVPAMAATIAELARDRGELRRLGAAARARMQNRFSPAIHFQELATILEKLSGTPAPDVRALAPDSTAAAVERLAVAAGATRRMVAVYGAGMFGRKVIDACLAREIAVSAWFDSDPKRAGSNYRGIVCASPASVPEWPGAVFVAASLQFAPEIVARIENEFALAGRPRPEILAVSP